MSTGRETATESGQGFHERLQQLRTRIDSLPEAQRPHLIDLAETIDRQYQQLQKRQLQNHVAD
jgi:hypothetical protein